MNKADFHKLVDEAFASCKTILDIKGTEYSDSKDVLANFKRGAMLTGLPPEQVLLVYLSKHFDSIATYCRIGQVEGGEPIYGRLKDAINYCLLLTALIDERGRGQFYPGSVTPAVIQHGKLVPLGEALKGAP